MVKQDEEEWALSHGEREEIRKYMRSWLIPAMSGLAIVLSLLSGFAGWAIGTATQAKAYETSIDKVTESAQKIAAARGQIDSLLGVLEDGEFSAEETAAKIERINLVYAKLEDIEPFLDDARSLKPIQQSITDLKQDMQSMVRLGDKVGLCRDSGCIHDENNKGRDELDLTIGGHHNWTIKPAVGD